MRVVLFCVLLAIVAVATIEAVSVSTLRQRVAERHAAKARTVTNIQSKNGVTVGKQLKSFVRFPQITSHSCYASATAMVVKMMSLTGAKRCPCEVFTTLESPIYNNVVTELAARRSRRKKASGDAPASAAKIEADDSEDEALDDKGAADRTPPEQRATDIVDDSNDEHCPVTPEVVEAAYKRNNPGHKLFTGGQVEEAMKEFGVRGEVYTGKQKLERGGKEEGQGNLPKFDDIKEEITAGRPVVLGVAQSGGAGHAVMIIGARLKSKNRELLTVDPYMGWKDPYWVDWPEGRNKPGAKFQVQDDGWLLFKVIFVHEAPDRSTFKSVTPGENINAKCGTTSRSKK